MASSQPPASSEAQIAVKIYFAGAPHSRLKLPLSQVGPFALENHIRANLSVPSDAPLEIRRWSDSESAWTPLDRANNAAYRQLYRAAKAKHKLKLSVTRPSSSSPSSHAPPLRPTPERPAVAPRPKPATVEDVPESTEAAAELSASAALPSVPSAPPNVITPVRPIATVPEHIPEEPAAKSAAISASDHVPEPVPDVAPEAAPEAALEPPHQPQPSDSSLPPMKQVESQLRNLSLESDLRKSLEEMEHNHEQLTRNLGKVEASFADLYKAWNQPKPEANTMLQPETSPEPTTSSAERWPLLGKSDMAMSIPRPNFTVCCNHCDKTTGQSHYHCSTCDDGDFDLCRPCVDSGATCHNSQHWLIKRFVRNGSIINSTSERIAPRSLALTQDKDQDMDQNKAEQPSASSAGLPVPVLSNWLASCLRTCNGCVQDLPEADFIHCKDCPDFDLCRSCFVSDNHGHDPSHEFTAAVSGTQFDRQVTRRFPAGRGQVHEALCDGCDRAIEGVRHKCMDCPDWDYCSQCILSASFIHPDHRFVAIYRPLPAVSAAAASGRPVHIGICCDGDNCTSLNRSAIYIVGDRFKCAICSDTDFCARCEASPSNTHNKTHPLIKFKTPVRNVSVTTSGEREDGSRMPSLGDRASIPILSHEKLDQSGSKSPQMSQPSEPSPVPAVDEKVMAATPVKTVVNVEPEAEKQQMQEPEPKPLQEPEPEPEPLLLPEAVSETEPEKPIDEQHDADKSSADKSSADVQDLIGVYVRDTVADGTVMAPNHVFEQTWYLRNEGTTAWPAGCSVKFVGGDYMGRLDPNHPAAVQELAQASESTVCTDAVQPGQEHAFTARLRTPATEGKAISYWRLTTDSGIKFGHRLWCDVDVKMPEIEESGDAKDEDHVEAEPSQSQMVFPKLEKESPVASIEDLSKGKNVADAVDPEFDEFEEAEWPEEDSLDGGLLTDEEYDILDASDEDFVMELDRQHK